MSRKIIRVTTCDRCDDEVKAPEGIDGPTELWGRLYAARNDGNDVAGSNENPADLCFACLSALAEFMEGRS